MTLDGVGALSDRDLMICSAERPMLASAASSAGWRRSVGDDHDRHLPRKRLFQSRVPVRKTAKKHGLNTDSSWRFERGVDPRLQVYALKRAAFCSSKNWPAAQFRRHRRVSAGEPADFVFDFSPARSNALIGKEALRTDRPMRSTCVLDDPVLWRVAVPPAWTCSAKADVWWRRCCVSTDNNVEIPVQVLDAPTAKPTATG